MKWYDITVFRHEINKYTVSVQADSKEEALEKYEDGEGQWDDGECIDCTHEEVTGIIEVPQLDWKEITG